MSRDEWVESRESLKADRSVGETAGETHDALP